MSTVVDERFGTNAQPARPLFGRVSAAALWFAASLIAVGFALLMSDSVILGDTFIPLTNDSFYHAHRILDAAVGGRGFYQFDERLHVPEGSWIPWPWAYDYLLAKATQLAVWIVPTLDPMAFLAYVPVAWLLVNSALFMAAARAVGLSRELQALAMFCFAFSPLTQLLHSIGMLDHHYVELTFVLATIWLGLRWFQQPGDARRAATLGAVLGAATAFHNGLFILQLFPLITVFVLWARQSAPPATALRAFGIALVAITSLALLPSEPFRRGMFEFGLHSWFHAYVAVCTAVAMAFMGWRAATRKTFLALAALCGALALPLASQLAGGAGFLSGSFSILDTVTEVRSPYKMFTETMGPTETAGYYSWLLLLAPLVVVFYLYRLVREHRPERVFFAVVVVLGVALLLDQWRLHYFGYFGLIAGTLLVIDELRARRALHRGLVFVVTFAALAVAFQPALRERLLILYAPSADPEYATAFSLFLELGKLCAESPGTVLANTDDGNPILFHTDCSVIANNFILRPEDKAHIDEVVRINQMTPEQIRAERPDIKYLLLRTDDFSIVRDGVSYLVTANPFAKQFFVDPEPPPGYTLVQAIGRRYEEGGPPMLYAKLFKVNE